LTEHLKELPDQRTNRTKELELLDLLAFAICMLRMELTIQGATLRGTVNPVAGIGAFAVSTPAGSLLPAGASESFIVICTPGALGERSAVMS
jgi:hypothetical protein